MSTKQLMRPQFFEGQYLGAEDLTATLDYARLSDARHALGAHTWGIAAGLALKEVDGPGGEVLVFIQPGFAWDGYGRPIIMLTPATVPSELLKPLVYDPLVDEPSGRLVEVWLRYREVKTQEPAEGFQTCNSGDNFARAFETYTVEVGERDADSMRDPIIVAGTSVKAEEAFRAFDPADPLIYDASIPHQTFPNPGGRQKWLVPLGYIRWKPNPVAALPGIFQKTLPADQTKTASFRVLVGAVAAAVQAPEGKIRIKNRTVEPSAVVSPDLLWVEGDLRAQGNVRLFGTKAAFVDALGQDQGAPLEIQRAGDNVAGGRFLQARIGSVETGTNRFEVGPDAGAGVIPKFVVRDDGRIGVGTTTPTAKVEIFDGDLVLRAAAEDSGDIIFQNKDGVQKARVWAKPTAGAALHLSSGDATPDITIDDVGQVGIGTETPNRAVTIRGNAGTYLNVIADGGTHEILIGADGNGGIVSTMTNHDLVFRSGVNNTRMAIKADGNVGVNTVTPAVQFHVVGNRIRLENNNKRIDLRADGSDVDLHSDTNSVFIRASGAAPNNTVAINSFAGDGNVGVGTHAPACKLHVVGTVAGDAGVLSNHVAVIDNTSSSAEADVLALRVATSPVNTGNNFITFFAGNNAVGSIEGDALGVRLNTTGADFAESLPLEEDIQVEPGDVVAIVNGRLKLETDFAHQLAAISTRPAIVGNAHRASQRHAHVALLGQTPVKVRGPVSAGDVLVPSGRNDGTAIALCPETAIRESRFDIIGTAWESSVRQEVKPIRTAIGMISSVLNLLKFSKTAKPRKIAAKRSSSKGR
jgi:hypothetical protein